MLSRTEPVALIERSAPRQHIEFDNPITTESQNEFGLVPTTEELQILVNVRVPNGPLGRRRSAPPMPVQSHVTFGVAPDMKWRRFPWLLDAAIAVASVAAIFSGLALGYLMQGIPNG